MYMSTYTHNLCTSYLSDTQVQQHSHFSISFSMAYTPTFLTAINLTFSLEAHHQLGPSWAGVLAERTFTDNLLQSAHFSLHLSLREFWLSQEQKDIAALSSSQCISGESTMYLYFWHNFGPQFLMFLCQITCCALQTGLKERISESNLPFMFC